MKTEGRIDPIGIDTATPAFSWQMDSSAVGAAQTAYQITVKDKEGSIVWDSGNVESSRSNEVRYEGPELSAAAAYTWNVSVTDQDGRQVQSGDASFETSLLDASPEAWDNAQRIRKRRVTCILYFSLQSAALSRKLPAAMTVYTEPSEAPGLQKKV